MKIDPKKVVAEMTERLGKHEAQRRLVNEGVSTSTAAKLVANRYEFEVKQLITQAIMRAAQKVAS